MPFPATPAALTLILLWGRSRPAPRPDCTLVHLNQIGWTQHLTLSGPARASSTTSLILHAHRHPIPHVLPTVACLLLPPVSDWRCRSNRRVEVSILLLPARFVSFPAVRICVLWLCCSALLNTCLVLLLCSHVFALLHALGSPIRLNSPPGSASGQRHVHDV